MRNIINLLLIFTGLNFFYSCTKDLRLSPISQISNASFWKSEDDADGALYGMYARFRTQSRNLFLWGELRSNDFGPSVGGEPIDHGILYRNTLNASSPLSNWLGLYSVIHDANLMLKYIPEISFSDDKKKERILAQAYAMRAYCYFVMARTWGGVPLVTQPTEGYSEDVQRERASIEDVFNLIKSDLDNAISLFPDNNFEAGRFNWSKPAVNTLKADVYLWTGKRMGGGNNDFTTALDALNEVEESDVLLLDDFHKIFEYNNKGNKEILFAIRFMDNESGETADYNQSFIHTSHMPLSEELDEETQETLSGGRGFSYLQVMPHVRDLFIEDKDQRRAASFKEIYIYEGGYPDGNKTYYTAIQTKFRGVLISGQRFWYDDYVIYRYGDVLLMKAEAKNALGEDPSEDMNKIRKRAYGNHFSEFEFVNNSKDVNDSEIIKEWLLEKAFEGRYWWDVIRFGKAFELVPSLQDKVGQDHLLLFPIPLSTLSIELKVVQNPGYD